jgi:hypothetical protein
MPETVTGSDLRSRADGLNAVLQGDERTFDRAALLGIVQAIQGDLRNAANTLERHEIDARRRDEPQQGSGAGSGQPTTEPPGTQHPLHPVGTEAHGGLTHAESVAGPERAEQRRVEQRKEAAAGQVGGDMRDAADKPRAKERIEK